MPLTHLATNLNSFLILTHMATHQQFTLVEFQVSYNKFDLVCYSEDCSSNKYVYKGYLPNLLVITLLPRIFVYWARYFKFWLLAYFWFCWTVQSLRKIGQHLYYTFFDVFCFFNLPKIKRGDPYINVVQSSSKFAQFSKI